MADLACLAVPVQVAVMSTDGVQPEFSAALQLAQQVRHRLLPRAAAVAAALAPSPFLPPLSRIALLQRAGCTVGGGQGQGHCLRRQSLQRWQRSAGQAVAQRVAALGPPCFLGPCPRPQAFGQGSHKRKPSKALACGPLPRVCAAGSCLLHPAPQWPACLRTSERAPPPSGHCRTLASCPLAELALPG